MEALAFMYEREEGTRVKRAQKRMEYKGEESTREKRVE